MVIPLTQEHLSAVVALHQRVLGHTLNARVGRNFLYKLYQATITHRPNGAGFVVTDDQHTIIGFITCCLDHQALQQYIMTCLGWRDYAQLLWFFFCHPWFIGTVLRRQGFDQYLLRHFPQPLSMVLTLGVDPHHQGKGLGRKLIAAVDTYMRQQQCTSYYLDTEVTNQTALHFYHTIGFMTVAQCYGNVIMRRDLLSG